MTEPREPYDRRKIQDAITAWRDGQTFDAIHPLADDDSHGILWDDNAMKDLARVIAHTLNDDPAVILAACSAWHQSRSARDG